MLTLLSRIFVGPFYAKNAGTFLVLIMLAFGFLSANEHRALIMAALGSPFFLAIVFGLWSLYLIKTISFIWQELTAPEHLFLQTFWLIPAPKRVALWMATQNGSAVSNPGLWRLDAANREARRALELIHGYCGVHTVIDCRGHSFGRLSPAASQPKCASVAASGYQTSLRVFLSSLLAPARTALAGAHQSLFMSCCWRVFASCIPPMITTSVCY